MQAELWRFLVFERILVLFQTTEVLPVLNSVIFFTSLNPPLYVYSCNKSIGAININANMSCLSWIFGMKYFVCLLRWLEPDFATEVTFFSPVNGPGVFKMKRVTVRKKRVQSRCEAGILDVTCLALSPMSHTLLPDNSHDMVMFTLTQLYSILSNTHTKGSVANAH